MYARAAADRVERVFLRADWAADQNGVPASGSQQPPGDKQSNRLVKGEAERGLPAFGIDPPAFQSVINHRLFQRQPGRLECNKITANRLQAHFQFHGQFLDRRTISPRRERAEDYPLSGEGDS